MMKDENGPLHRTSDRGEGYLNIYFGNFMYSRKYSWWVRKLLIKQDLIYVSVYNSSHLNNVSTLD